MNERNKDKYFWIAIILLIIIILILLYFTRFGKIENKYLTPTGNIDVFNIDISCNCNNEETCIADKKNDTKNNTYPVWNEEENKEELETVYVDDKNGNYIYQQNLNIFSNAFYEYANKIAPGVSNTYYFVIHNNSDIDVNYYVEMYETTNYNINLKYRLKRNGAYVIGDNNNWVSANELKTEFSKLNIKNSDKYSLDWKWAYDSGTDNIDTYIGENMNESYKLNIRFYLEQVEL